MEQPVGPRSVSRGDAEAEISQGEAARGLLQGAPASRGVDGLVQVRGADGSQALPKLAPLHPRPEQVLRPAVAGNH